MRVKTVTKLSSVAHCQKQNSFIVNLPPLICRHKMKQTTGSVAAATRCQSYCLGALTTKKQQTIQCIRRVHSAKTIATIFVTVSKCNNGKNYKEMLRGPAKRVNLTSLGSFFCNKVTCQTQVVLSMFENYLNDSEKLSVGKV